MGRLPEAWVAPPRMRELREMVRHRAKLVALRAGCKCEVHAVLAKCGTTGPDRRPVQRRRDGVLEQLRAQSPYQARVGSLRRLIDHVDAEIDLFATLVRGKQRSRLVRWAAIESVQSLGPATGADQLNGSRTALAATSARSWPPASRSITSTSPCAAGTCAPCTSGQQHEAIANLLVAAGSCRS
jgi:hypothetical protein